MDDLWRSGNIMFQCASASKFNAYCVLAVKKTLESQISHDRKCAQKLSLLFDAAFIPNCLCELVNNVVLVTPTDIIESHLHSCANQRVFAKSAHR